MNTNGVIRFFWKALLFLVIVVACDRVIGWGLEKLFYAQKHGDDFVSIYLLEHAKEDIIILGSSRASHHYNAQVIEDSTGMTCFNGGRDNMSIDYINATLPEVYKNHIPKTVIIEILPTELTANAHARQMIYERTATALLPFYNRHPALKNTIALAGQMELVKAKASRIYSYNSTIGSSIQNAYTHIGHIGIKGYEPLSSTIDSATYKKPIWGNFTANGKVDSTMLNSFRSVIAEAKKNNTRLIAILSPLYFPANFQQNDGYKAVVQLFKDEGIEFHDYSHDSRFLMHPHLFADDVHLNDSGATIYSGIIAQLIKE